MVRFSLYTPKKQKGLSILSILSVEIAGIHLRNPIIVASATPSWDGQRTQLAWKAGAGAVVPKSFGPPDHWANHPRCGRMKLITHNNQKIGMVNVELYTTMPLQRWLDEELELAFGENSNIIASVVAHPDPDQTAKHVRIIEETGKISMTEINVSCPMPLGSDKVGFQMGNDPALCFEQISTIKKLSSLPVGIKLTPTTFNMVPMAEASKAGGADFLVIGNSVRAFAGVDIYTGLPKLPAYGGYSGPAIKPITQRHVSEVARKVDIPIIAVGGISTYEDIIEYIMLGASAVQICTSIMWNGYSQVQKLLADLEYYMQEHTINNLVDIRGKTLPYIKTIEAYAQNTPLTCRLDTNVCINHKTGKCNKCSTVCFYGAIGVHPTRIFSELCDGCGLCTEICPVGALTLR